ncbi:hypothetical protein Tco_0597648 [Tanacetum coccineum]
MIYGGVRASKPNIMQDAIEFVTKLMDKKISTPAERQAENKRGRHGEKKHYGGSNVIVLNATIHHDGSCSLQVSLSAQSGHLDHDFRSIQMLIDVGIKGTLGNDCTDAKNQKP